ncbi:MAG: hypothetical protein ACQEST_08655 [Bacteroidota bacterium]
MNILFWSGGKDSYLALHFFKESHPDADITLLTTYEESSNIVPHQHISLDEIEMQAEYLGMDLITVALPQECPNTIYLKKVEEALQNVSDTIDNLIFGDWYLQDIRDWRKKVFGDMGYSCLFPIWKKDLQELLSILFLQPIRIEISAVKEEYQSLLKVGEPYDQKLVTQLQRLEEIDPMGEKGEFHTKVIFNSRDKPTNQPLAPRY